MRLEVEGMTCGHCKRAIENAIAAIGGLIIVRVRPDADA